MVAVLCFVATAAFGADANERRFIREGMSEGEVLMRIGKPDSQSEDSGGGASVAVKRWIYLPAYGDPQTLTTIVIRKGKVEEVIREVAR
jgi:hypothetical protein